MATITCLFAFNLRIAKGNSGSMHSHPCTEIVIYRGASGTLTQGGKEMAYGDGCVAIYQPHLRHHDECVKSGTHLCLGVTGCGADRLPAGMYRANDHILIAAGQIICELQRGDSINQAKVEFLSGWVVTELQHILATASNENIAGNASSFHVQTAQMIFETRFRESISISSVAEELYIHPDYLRQLFRKQLGETPIHFLLRKRIECARSLLKDTDQSIKEIAAQSGLENPFYFSRLFRKWIGQSPSEYRARHRSASRLDQKPARKK